MQRYIDSDKESKRENERERETKGEKETRIKRQTKRKKETERKRVREKHKNTHTHTRTHNYAHKQACAQSHIHIKLFGASGVPSSSLTVLVRVLNNQGTGASESLWCICCGNLNIMTVLGGVFCQITSIPSILDMDITSIPSILDMDVLKSFAYSSPPK